jgi:hypothetical protein
MTDDDGIVSLEVRRTSSTSPSSNDPPLRRSLGAFAAAAVVGVPLVGSAASTVGIAPARLMQ